MAELVAPPLSLYVHLPWCVSKCPYCDFNSHARAGVLPEAAYVQALLADLEHDLPRVRGRALSTVFFGGGTPSLFAPASIAAVLAGVRARIELAAQAEITLEANPGTVEHGRFGGYREAGVNRVSLGAQSFDAAQLKTLGRIHGPADTARAVAELRAAPCDNFNLDLMYALPAQQPAAARADVATALALEPTHLSHYQLTLEPGTVFHQRPPPLPDEELVQQIESTTQSALSAAGFHRYEISAWSRPGAECRHNLNYWRFGDYLGIGAGAHGKLTDAATQTIVRTVKTRQPREYLERAAAGRTFGETAEVPPRERPFEFMLNALRLPAGFQYLEFEARTGLDRADLEAPLAEAAARGLLESTAQGARPTALGLRFLNDLQALFLATETRVN